MATTIETFFARLMGGDLAAALELVSEDTEFVAVRPGADLRPDILYGTYRGHEGVRHFVGKLGTIFETEYFRVEHAASGPGIEFAAGSFRHRIRATGKLFESKWAVLCALQNNRIRHYQFFEDTAALEDAMRRD